MRHCMPAYQDRRLRGLQIRKPRYLQMQLYRFFGKGRPTMRLHHLTGAREYTLDALQAKPEEVVYRSLTVAAMLLILASLWAF